MGCGERAREPLLLVQLPSAWGGQLLSIRRVTSGSRHWLSFAAPEDVARAVCTEVRMMLTKSFTVQMFFAADVFQPLAPAKASIESLEAPPQPPQVQMTEGFFQPFAPAKFSIESLEAPPQPPQVQKTEDAIMKEIYDPLKTSGDLRTKIDEGNLTGPLTEAIPGVKKAEIKSEERSQEKKKKPHRADVRRTLMNGAIYEGQVRGNVLSGRGRMQWEDGALYVGEFANDCRNGHGTFRHGTTGMVYEGQFVNDKMHGEGCCSFVDGRKYEGQVTEGQIEGTGKMTWPNGAEYFGQYVKSLKHGTGVFKWPDGRQYEGDWKNGKQDGMGATTDASGAARVSRWSQGRMLANPSDKKSQCSDNS